jgi:hypothetical protein
VPGFDFFHSPRHGYSPRTPGAALRAVGIGAAVPEHFIYASCSAKPLTEEPFDLEAIERTLARTDLGIESAKLLKAIFEKMIMSREPETALFGAEGINALEARYLNRIERLKSEREEDGNGARPRLLARSYFELAELHGKARTIRAFYLREAYSALKRSFTGHGRVSRAALALIVDILVGLGLFGQASGLLARVKARDDPTVVLLAARVAFHRREFAKVVELCRVLKPTEKTLREADGRLVRFWAGV